MSAVREVLEPPPAGQGGKHTDTDYDAIFHSIPCDGAWYQLFADEWETWSQFKLKTKAKDLRVALDRRARRYNCTLTLNQRLAAGIFVQLTPKKVRP